MDPAKPIKGTRGNGMPKSRTVDQTMDQAAEQQEEAVRMRASAETMRTQAAKSWTEAVRMRAMVSRRLTALFDDSTASAVVLLQSDDLVPSL